MKAAVRRGRPATTPVVLLLLALAAPWIVSPPASGAYTVVTASRDVTVDCGTSGTDLPTDWYFPQPNPNLGLVWVQHGFSRTNNQFVDLATTIAAQGYVVFAPSIAPGTSGCALNNAGFLSDFARLFPDLATPGVGLLASATLAAQSLGITLGGLPSTFAFAGHSAGGAAAVAVARHLVVTHPATAANLRGLTLLDPVESASGQLIESNLPSLAAVPIYTVSSPPYSCNSNASGTVLLTALPRPFVGVRLTSGCHCDAEGSSTDFLCTAFCGTPQAENVSILKTLTTGWLGDLFPGGFTPDWYPSGAYFESKVAAGRIVPLPSPSACGNGAVGVGEQCDDGNRANGDCCNAICRFDAAGASCGSDGNGCTDDVCSGAGACGVPNTAACDDGVFCNGADTCSGGVCAQHAGDPCAAGAECARTCNEASDGCFAPAGTACTDDGSPCSRDECNGGGTCAHPAANPGLICRAAAGDCDAVEACDGVQPACPADARKPAGTACRASAGPCDPAETCDGAAAACAADSLAPAGTVCRAAAGPCDVAETCTGVGPACPANAFRPASVVCRGAAGVCDVAEHCSGAAASCPADAFVPGGTVCRAAAGECDVAETCGGLSAACPANGFATAGSGCAADALPCTADVCDGGGACMHPAGNAGAVCRVSTGPCDLAEACDGVATACPVDTGVSDGDGDGRCDAQDPCTNVAGGRSFLARPAPKLKLARAGVDPVPGDDVLVLKGTFVLPAGAGFGDVAPLARGGRLVVESAGGIARADVALPPGAYAGSGTAGWVVNGAGTAWTFRDRRPVGATGIAKLVVKDRSRRGPGQVEVKVSGKAVTVAAAAGDEPLRAIVTLGDPAAAADGLCGESAFAAGQCRWSAAGTALSCGR